MHRRYIHTLDTRTQDNEISHRNESLHKFLIIARSKKQPTSHPIPLPPPKRHLDANPQRRSPSHSGRASALPNDRRPPTQKKKHPQKSHVVGKPPQRFELSDVPHRSAMTQIFLFHHRDQPSGQNLVYFFDGSGGFITSFISSTVDREKDQRSGSGHQIIIIIITVCMIMVGWTKRTRPDRKGGFHVPSCLVWNNYRVHECGSEAGARTGSIGDVCTHTQGTLGTKGGRYVCATECARSGFGHPWRWKPMLAKSDWHACMADGLS